MVIPLLNPNEPEALIASIQVANGQFIAAGDVLCTLETTKSTAELVAEQAGYVAGLKWQAGQVARASELFCYLASDSDWTPPAPAAPPASPSIDPDKADLPSGLRITQPALALARQHQLDLAGLPQDRLITEKIVRSFLTSPASEVGSPMENSFDPAAIIIYGGGGHGKSLIDLLRQLHIYRILGIVDDGIPAGTQILGLPVLGGAEILAGLYQQGVRLAVNAVGGIGNIQVRLQVFENLRQAGLACPAVVHPTAHVEPSATLASGVQVFAQAYVGSAAQVGFGAIINTGAILSHDCVIGEVANISPGAILAGEVEVGRAALVGMGATLNLRVKVGAWARIGNGATVKEDVPEKGVVRAGTAWPI